MPPRPFAALLLCGLAACGPSAPGEAVVLATEESALLPSEVLLDSFTTSTSTGRWAFSPGAEFPGAAGGLTFQGGKALLRADFTRGGRYVAASRSFSSPQAATSISFTARVPAGISLAVRVLDGTGQWLQYDVATPTAAWNPAAATRYTVPLEGPATCWMASGSGRCSGVYGGSLRALSLVANDAQAPSPAALRLADLDGDGRLEVLVANSPPTALPEQKLNSATLAVLRASGAGLAVTHAVTSTPGASGLAVADLTADGHPDVLSVGTFAVGLHEGRPSAPGAKLAQARPLEGLSRATSVAGVAAVDLDGDGHPELVASETTSDQLVLLPGLPGGGVGGASRWPAWAATCAAPPCASPGPLVAADLDGDGRRDVAVALTGARAVAVLYNLGNRQLSAPVVTPLPQGVVLKGLATADFNLDGAADLVTANGSASTVTVLSGKKGVRAPLAATHTRACGAPWCDATAVAAARLDGDRFVDVAVASGSGHAVATLLGQGNGAFAWKGTWPAGAAPVALAAGSVTASGRADILVANHGSGNVGLLASNGDGTLAPVQLASTAPWPGATPVSARAAVVELDDVAAGTKPGGPTFELVAGRSSPAPAAPPLREVLGANVHVSAPWSFSGSTLPQAELDRLDLLAAAGVGALRYDAHWGLGEPTAGHYAFTRLDALAAAAQQRGQSLLLLVAGSNPAHADGMQPAGTPCPAQPTAWAPGSPPQRAAYAAYAGALAGHFAGNAAVRFELWNEPNGHCFWFPRPDADAYGALASAALASMRAASPSARIAVGALDRFEWGYLDPLLSGGGAQGADALSVHPYRSGPPESFLEELRVLRGALRARLPLAGLEPWSSEWGWSSTWMADGSGTTGHGHDAVARRRQAVMVARTALSAWAAGLPLSIHYDVSDDCADEANPECNFGLLDTALQPKAAYTALATLSARAAGRSLGPLPWTPAPWVHAVELHGAPGRVVAVWLSRPGSCARVRLPAGSTVVDLLGAPRAVQPAGPGAALAAPLCEADGPIYATVP